MLSTHHSLARWAGADRYATAVAISKGNFDPGVAAVFIATGRNYPDALSGGPAAKKLGSPLLLVDGSASAAPAVVQSELARLKPANIYVLGGAGAVSDALLASLRGFTSGAVSRLAGVDRYATSALISRRFFAAGVPVVYIATGRNYPDALAGAGPAGARGGPLLLADGASASLPASVRDELARLKPAQIVVVGSTGVFNGTLFSALDSYSPSVVRVSGASRYDTSAAATRTLGKQTMLLVATGDNYPDALAGAALGKPIASLRCTPSTKALAIASSDPSSNTR